MAERCGHACDEHTLRRVDHPANARDRDSPGSWEGYQVFKCADCGIFWGCRYQYDMGTGADDHWQRFTHDPSSVQRHY